MNSLICKSSVTIEVVTDMFATGAWQAQAVRDVLWRCSEKNIKGTSALMWFSSKLLIPEILVDVILIQGSIHALMLARSK